MKFQSLIFLSMVFAVVSCRQNRYYSGDDFYRVEKIDAHYHILTREENSLDQARHDNFKLININTFWGCCEDVVDAHHTLRALKQQHPASMEFTATFCLDGWDDAGWAENTTAWIDQCIGDGALAVKVWKNIGMGFRSSDSALVMIDDPQFSPVFSYLEDRGIPLAGHLGEPRNCWLPLEEMTTKSDSSYYAQNPQFHMYLHPDAPSYEEQLAARDRMLENHPRLVFIACHLASLEWSVDEMARFLDRFPTASLDLAARMGQLYYQTVGERKKVRNFFIRYQDRLLYGTDIADRGGCRESFQDHLHQTWLTDWEFLVTDNRMSSNRIDDSFRGLKLPKEVVDKIYAANARKWYRF